MSFLIKHKLINQIKEGNKTRYFPKDFNFSDKELMSLLRQKNIRRIIIFILINSNCKHEELVKYVRLSPSTVSWYLKRLEAGKIIHSIKKGRNTHYSILSNKEEIVKLLITYQESFLDSLVDRVIEMWSIK